MGNPAWGHGYHKGFGDGAKQGGVVGALITLGATGLVVGGRWAIGKLRERSTAKQLDANSAAETSREDEHGPQTDSTD